MYLHVHVKSCTSTASTGTFCSVGCPSPFRKFHGTTRINNTDDAREFQLSPQLGFTTPEDECKYHCLSIGTCSGQCKYHGL